MCNCHEAGDENDHKCDSCKVGLSFDLKKPTNCVVNCQSEGKKWINQTDLIETCYDECPADYPYLVVNTNECLSSCQYYTDAPLYTYLFECYLKCPNNTRKDDEIKKFTSVLDELQKEDTETKNNPNEVKYSSNSSVGSVMDNMDEFVALSLTQSNDKITVIEGKDSTFNFYSSSLENKNAGISLGPCEDLLRTTYNIPSNEELFIATLSYNMGSGSPFNKTQYVVYNEEGIELDLSPCNAVNITETKTINPECEELNYDIAKTLLEEQGINIYDPNEPVFNDRCTSLQVNGKDTTMSDRKNKIHSKVSLCDEGCEMKNLDINTNQVDCDCPPQTSGISMNNIINSNPITNQFNELLGNTNLFLFTCYKRVFELKDIHKKYGAFIGVILMICEIPCIIVLLMFHLQLIIVSICQSISFNPTSKEKYCVQEIEIIDNCSNEMQMKHSQESSSKEAFVKHRKKSKHRSHSIDNDEIEDPSELNEMSY